MQTLSQGFVLKDESLPGVDIKKSAGLSSLLGIWSCPLSCLVFALVSLRKIGAHFLLSFGFYDMHVLCSPAT